MLPVAISASTAGVSRAAVAAAVEPEIGRPRDLALAHRDAAEHLRQVFAGTDADQKLFDVAEAARLHHPVGVVGELTDRLDVGCEPGKPVGGALLAVKRARIGPAVAHDASGDRQTGVRQQPLRGCNPLS